MKIKVAQIIGLNTDQKAALTSYQQREEEAFLAVLQLTCDDAFTKGRLALSELSDFYFEFGGSLAEKLNATFEEALKKFSKDEFDLIVAVASGKTLYLIGQGNVQVYLKRSDEQSSFAKRSKLSQLLSIGAPKQLISGFLQAGDRILLSTKSLITFLGDDLEKSLDLPIDTFEEEISSRVGVQPLPDDIMAGIALEIVSEEEQPIPPLPQQEGQYEPVQDQESQYTKTSTIKNIFTNLLANIWKLGASFGIKHYFPKSGRGRLILALVLVATVAAGVGFQYKSNRDKDRQMQFNQNLQSAKDEFTAAKGLSNLNPQEAKGKLTAAKNKITLALSLNPSNEEAKDLQKQIEEQSSSILQEFETSEFPVFLDLDLIKKDYKAQNLSLSAGKILLLDTDTKTLVSVDINKKSHEILSGKEKLGDARFTSINGSLAFVHSEDKGIVKVDVTNRKDTQVSKKDSDWGQIQDIAGFASNVYLLDTVKNQIWKYLPTSTGYSDKREYLTKATKADFAGALRMQIESSIYVLKQGGEILRFTRGEKDHFSLGGLDKGVKDPKSLFVSSDTDNLYLLDSGNARLLILTKIGEYKGQIKGDKFGTASDLVVDEKGKKVYLLEGNKIYSVDLK